MSEQNKSFVITDRRKFSSDGSPREESSPEQTERTHAADEKMPAAGAAEGKSAAADFPAAQRSEASVAPTEPAPREPASPPPSLGPTPISSTSLHGESLHEEPAAGASVEELPPPSQQEMEQAGFAYQQTAERLENAVRAANLGGEPPVAMTFEQIVHSIYMTSIMQLGGATPEGQTPKVDLLGARQSIDMLGILAEKTKGNLSEAEAKLLDSALFDLRMGFLEVTQALARSAASRQAEAAPAGGRQPGRPSLVR